MKRTTLLLAVVALVATTASAQPQATPGCCDQGYTKPATGCCDQGYGTKRYLVAAGASLLLLGAAAWHRFNNRQHA